MTSTRMYAYGELEDGTTWQNLPVPVASRIQIEQTAHGKRWTAETHSMTYGAFLSWHAAKAKGIHSLTWEDFIASAVDAGVDSETTDEPDPDETPTQTAPSTA